MPLRLLVIDGADKGRFFVLPDSGTVLIGNSARHADVCLHDLYVSRVHCELTVEAGRVTVAPRDTPGGTLINNKKISRQELQAGEVLRAGNSHLRLEIVTDVSALTPLAESDEPAGLPQLAPEQLNQLVGHTLGHYELSAVLGRSRTGFVFQATDLNSDQPAALKVLAADFPANDTEMQQFVRTLKTRLHLSHAHLVALRGAGKSGPYCWIAMELVEGESLAQEIERRRTMKKPKWGRALDIALDIGRALVFIHQHRVRHGNLTPANILIPTNGDLAKLNDLLLQTALDGSVLQQRTMEDKLLAELPYLFPEQADPQVSFIDDLTDVYSLGVITYAVLTGRTPFGGASPEEILRQIREDQPIKPQKLQKMVPDEFQAAVLKMMAKRPEDRYPSAAQMLSDLERMAARHDRG